MNSELDQPKTNLKLLLVSLLQSLGMFAQATNVKEQQFYEDIDEVMFIELLSKFDLTYSILPTNEAKLEKTKYPFIIIGVDDNASLVRRTATIFKKQTIDGQWIDFALASLKKDDYVITIQGLPQNRKKGKTFSGLLEKRKKWIKPIFWLSLFSSITGLAIPLFTMAVYDRVIGGQSSEILPSIALGAFIAVAIFILSRLVRAKILSEQSNRLAREMSFMSFKKLMYFPLILLSRVGLASHLYRLRNTERIRTLLSGQGGGGLIDLPFSIIVFLTIMMLSGWLVLVPLGMIILYYTLMLLLDKYVQAAMPTISIEYQDALNEISEKASQIKNSGFSDAWTNKFFKLCQENARQNFIYAKRNGLNAAVSQCLSMFTTLATVFAGIFLVLDESISSGALIACVMLIGRVTGPAQMAFMSRHKIHMINMSIVQFDRFMETPTELSAQRLKQIDITKIPTLSFSQVSLRYSGDAEAALSGISAEVAAGEIVAVIGSSGSGKSSLLSIAHSIIEPQSGVVLLNGVNIKQYDPISLRTYISYGAIEPLIINSSVRENLLIGNENATDEEIITALESAGGERLLKSIDYNLDFELFEDGISLLAELEGSYLTLARALLKDSKLFIFDDPLANQNKNEKEAFINTLQALRGKVTILFATHDQELIKQADKVLILDKGKLAFFGKLPAGREADSIQEKK